jgi:predicted ATP-binding protein involved in virulence
VLDLLIASADSIPFKDWGGPTLAALIALTGVFYTQRSKIKMAQEQQARDDKVRANSRDRTFDIAATQDLTARFKALMDGYEARILDLVKEQRDTKQELREARMEITRLRERLDAG